MEGGVGIGRIRGVIGNGKEWMEKAVERACKIPKHSQTNRKCLKWQS